MHAVNAYCSWCYCKSTHEIIERNVVFRNRYKCNICHNETLICRYCSEMARGKPNSSILQAAPKTLLRNLENNWNNEICAEHDGTIASFQKLDVKLDDIADYQHIFEREKPNLSKIGKYIGVGVIGVGGVAATAATMGGGAGAFAAALGKLGLLGATAKGTAIASLHGAPLMSASLAAIGGSMAAGTTIISAAGLSLGGVLGGVVANSYYSEDKSFRISKLQDNGTPEKTIFINGFTQENDIDFQDWQSGQQSVGPVPTLYSVNWSSKTNAKLGATLVKGTGSQAAKHLLIQLAKSGSKKGAVSLNPLRLQFFVAALAGNPWHCSMVRAAQAGVLLAEAMSRTENQKFNLVGHSLGCRVIFYALEALSTKRGSYVGDVIMLGGAVGNTGWEKATSSVSGNIYNCYSRQDAVLSRLYTVANAFLSSPIGVRPIKSNHRNLKNINCGDFVESHMSWKQSYSRILKKIYKN